MTMPPSIAGQLLAEVEGLYADFVRTMDDVDAERCAARPAATAPSIGFHLWHTARWADLFQARFPTFAPSLARLGPNEEIWVRDRVAATWGLEGGLGRNDSGWGLDDAASGALDLPPPSDLLVYANDAFGAAVRLLAQLADDELLVETGNIYGEDEVWLVVDHFGWHLGHGARHLGMIEALKGVLGMRGTVTS
ncbi:MAG TPA: DinB family protein [Actinomycetota bacterium]